MCLRLTLNFQFLFQINQDKKVADESAPQKFTPLIVTEKKIISLKKKPAEGPSDSQSQKPKTLMVTRKNPAYAEHVAAIQSGSQIKSTLRSGSGIGVSNSGSKKLRIDDDNDDIDEEQLLEDELLADSPPATPPAAAALKSRMNAATKVGDIPTSIFTNQNRRVVVRNADTISNNENILTSTKITTTTTTTASGTTGKGIFDRLEKKVISVNESAKRKIQRIVINNTSD